MTHRCQLPSPRPPWLTMSSVGGGVLDGLRGQVPGEPAWVSSMWREDGPMPAGALPREPEPIGCALHLWEGAGYAVLRLVCPTPVG